MIGTTGQGWLYSLRDQPNSSWGDIESFYSYVDDCEIVDGSIIIDSEVWGTLQASAPMPTKGDGFAFYHSTHARFPERDPFKRRPRISLMGKLLDIRLNGRNIE